MQEDDNLEEGGVIKRILYVNRRQPHGSIYAQESLETVLIGAAFDQDVSMLFLDDGVFQIKSEQSPDALEMKNFSKTYRALEMYDVEKIYVEKESMDARGLSTDDLLIDVEIVTRDAVSAMIAEHDVVLGF